MVKHFDSVNILSIEIFVNRNGNERIKLQLDVKFEVFLIF